MILILIIKNERNSDNKESSESHSIRHIGQYHVILPYLTNKYDKIL